MKLENRTAASRVRPKANPPIADKTVKLLASSIYQSLKDEGCETKDIIGVSSQLIGLVTSSIGREKN